MKNKDMFPIETLIEVFEKAIPVYQKAVDENWSCKKLDEFDIDDGICAFSKLQLDIGIYDVINRYYKNYLKRGYLFPISLYVSKPITESIKPRLDFMKSEVIELRKLMGKGYTHI